MSWDAEFFRHWQWATKLHPDPIRWFLRTRRYMSDMTKPRIAAIEAAAAEALQARSDGWVKGLVTAPGAPVDLVKWYGSLGLPPTSPHWPGVIHDKTYGWFALQYIGQGYGSRIVWDPVRRQLPLASQGIMYLPEPSSY